MDQAQQRSQNLQLAQEAILKAEQDESVSPLKLAIALDQYAELLEVDPDGAEQAAAMKTRARTIRADYYKKELENDSTSEVELRAMLRQASKDGGIATDVTPETITSVEDFEQLIAARSSSLTKGKAGKASGAKTLVIIITVVFVAATVCGFIFALMHTGHPH